MTFIPSIKKVTVSPLFWSDLRDLRRSPDYVKIRGNIAKLVYLAAQGLPAGDMPFVGDKVLWKGIGHAHVGSKLTLFTTRPESDEIRICCLKKHDFYGFGSERANKAGTAARVVRNASDAPHRSRPDWPGIKWKEPGDIISHPEMRELSDRALVDLSHEIEGEMDTLERFEGHVKNSGLSARLQDRVLDGWAEDLKSALERVDAQIAQNTRRQKAYLEPEVMSVWLDQKGTATAPGL